MALPLLCNYTKPFVHRKLPNYLILECSISSNQQVRLDQCKQTRKGKVVSRTGQARVGIFYKSVGKGMGALENEIDERLKGSWVKEGIEVRKLPGLPDMQ